jgi:hypothetical protein
MTKLPPPPPKYQLISIGLHGRVVPEPTLPLTSPLLLMFKNLESQAMTTVHRLNTLYYNANAIIIDWYRTVVSKLFRFTAPLSVSGFFHGAQNQNTGLPNSCSAQLVRLGWLS